MDKVRLLIEN